MAETPIEAYRKRAVLKAKKFSDFYKQQVFQIWYSLSKPYASDLMTLIPPDGDSGVKPSMTTLEGWIREIFIPQAALLDEQVRMQMESRLVKEKVEMLERHAKIGGKMQDTALSFLDKHRDELTVSSAIRMLVEGVRIERESKGIPGMMQKIIDKTDEELLQEIHEIISKAPVIELPELVEPSDANND